MLKLWSRLLPAGTWISLCLLDVMASSPPAAASDLIALAEIHAASGYEGKVVKYVQSQLGGGGAVDNTGSLTVTFGKGSPHTLLIAGLDEPGFVVSGINEQGYLRLERLADPSPHYDFDTFFQGHPVGITRKTGQPLAGVVAAPSVTFQLRPILFSPHRPGRSLRRYRRRLQNRGLGRWRGCAGPPHLGKSPVSARGGAPSHGSVDFKPCRCRHSPRAGPCHGGVSARTGRDTGLRNAAVLPQPRIAASPREY